MFVVITAAFRTLYVFVVMEIRPRQILHLNATAHPTAEWTLQQFREALPGDHPYRLASTIATAYSLRMSTEILPIWVYGFYLRRCEPATG